MLVQRHEPNGESESEREAMIVISNTRSTMVHMRAAWISTGTVACLICVQIAIGAEPLSYNRDIRPVLSDNCFACHGPDQSHQEGGLRLDLREVAVQPADSGEIAIVPGEPDASEMMTRVLSEDPDMRMPPPTSGHTLTAAQKQVLRRWIAEGAEYQRHWSFEPIRKAPATGNAIDFFIRKALNDAGLQPSPP